ncbi:hypothetical protein EYF80_045985 [Liparis tanakae]|uniref:Uncharacterized protein n=1 Tax=Liparis tanakae TaxID=230148 RepID=A0A4Z2FRP0_9TELE|nr:hypothetical protein EYF80_045985 [Liparis tanakae]
MDLKGPEGTRMDLKGPGWTLRDLKGPEGTWMDLMGPEGAWVDPKLRVVTSMSTPLHTRPYRDNRKWARRCLQEHSLKADSLEVFEGAGLLGGRGRLLVVLQHLVDVGLRVEGVASPGGQDGRLRAEGHRDIIRTLRLSLSRCLRRPEEAEPEQKAFSRRQMPTTGGRKEPRGSQTSTCDSTGRRSSSQQRRAAPRHERSSITLQRHDYTTGRTAKYRSVSVGVKPGRVVVLSRPAAVTLAVAVVGSGVAVVQVSGLGGRRVLEALGGPGGRLVLEALGGPGGLLVLEALGELGGLGGLGGLGRLLVLEALGGLGGLGLRGVRGFAPGAAVSAGDGTEILQREKKKKIITRHPRFPIRHGNHRRRRPSARCIGGAADGAVKP